MISLNEICRKIFNNTYSSNVWQWKYSQRKLLKALIKEHIKKDIEDEQYIKLFIDVMSLMHIEGVNLDFIKIQPK